MSEDIYSSCVDDQADESDENMNMFPVLCHRFLHLTSEFYTFDFVRSQFGYLSLNYLLLLLATQSGFVLCERDFT